MKHFWLTKRNEGADKCTEEAKGGTWTECCSWSKLNRIADV